MTEEWRSPIDRGSGLVLRIGQHAEDRGHPVKESSPEGYVSVAKARRQCTEALEEWCADSVRSC